MDLKKKKGFLKRQLADMKLNMRIDKALQNGEIQVFYQPKIEAGSTRVIGAEALVRWKKEDGTYVYPDEFIPALEQSGKIVELDFFVYRHVFVTLRKRLDERKKIVPVAMNVSRVHIKDGKIFSYVKQLFQEYKIPPKYIEFELTESMYVQNIEEILAVVKEFRQCGGRVSMDDFGSGYSSLNLLTDLPIDTIKIDRIFLRNKTLSENEKIILSCVVEMAKQLKMDVVCEGVETEEQSWFLSLLGCDMFQGYLYAKPLPEDKFFKYFEEHQISEIHEIHFGFQGNLKDDSGSFEGIMRGEEISYCEGPAEGMGGLHFSSGEPFMDCVELPVDVLKNTSFSVNMWIKEEKARLWTGVYYAGYENGFTTIMPRAWDMKMSFRIKDGSDHDGWYDVGKEIISSNEWTMVTACYDSVKKVSTIYLNGAKAGVLKDVYNLVSPKVIFIGGDIYAKGFEGCISDVSIYDQPLSFEQIREIYQKVQSRRSAEIEDDRKKSDRDKENREEFHFSLNGTLEETEKKAVLLYQGKELQYVEGPAAGSRAVYFPGGGKEENVLSLTGVLEDLKGYTISYWIKDDNPRPWVSSFYMETERGFMSEIPTAQDDKTIFRVKDINRENDWCDTVWERIIEKGKWHQIVLVYQSDINMIAHYVDGKQNGLKDGTFELGRVKRILFGGDIYQNSFEGSIADIHIYNYPMDVETVMELTKLSPDKGQETEKG